MKKQIKPLDPNSKKIWKPSKDAVLEDLDYGSVRHYQVMNEDNEMLYDRPYVLERPGISAILPIKWAEWIGLINIYRHGVLKNETQGTYPNYKPQDFGEWEWEAPRGFSEEGESPVEAAKRELEEETGMKCIGNPWHVGRLILNSDMLPTPLDLFFVEVEGEPVPQKEEGIREIKFFPKRELRDLSKQIRCSITLSLIAHYCL